MNSQVLILHNDYSSIINQKSFRGRIKIGVVAVVDKKGGRKTFINNLSKALVQYGYNARLVTLEEASISELNDFDVLCFSDCFFGKNTWKILFVRPKKILTVHGWVKKEAILELKRNTFKVKIRILVSLISWKILPSFFKIITSPSINTAKVNGLKHVEIIKNGIFINDYSAILPIDIRTNDHQFVFVTYSSAGGLNLSTERVIRVLYKLNEQLKDKGQVILLVFGSPLNTCDSNLVRYMGYSTDFVRYLKGSDLFIMGYSFSELGYAMLEAGALGVPTAKFTNDKTSDELMDNETAILANDEDEMVEKLLYYLTNIDVFKPKLGNALQKYVQSEKNWDNLIVHWSRLFSRLLSQ